MKTTNDWTVIECPACSSTRFDFLEITPPTAKLKCKRCGLEFIAGESGRKLCAKELMTLPMEERRAYLAAQSDAYVQACKAEGVPVVENLWGDL